MKEILFTCICGTAKVTHMGSHLRLKGTEDAYVSPVSISARCMGCERRFSVPVTWPALQDSSKRAIMTSDSSSL